MFSPRLALSFTFSCLVVCAAATTGCKPKVPDEYKSLVPEEGLRKAIPIEASPGRAGGMMLFYKATVPDLKKAFEKSVSASGYDLLMKCTDANVVVGAKDANTVANVSFMTLGEEVNANLDVGEMRSVGFPKGKDCEWTDDAEKYCDVAGDDCLFATKAKKKK